MKTQYANSLLHAAASGDHKAVRALASGMEFMFLRYYVKCRDIFIREARGGAFPPLNFDILKRSKIWYVACGTIIRRVAEAAKCKSSAIDFWIFVNLFLMWYEMSGPLSHAVYRKVHNCGPFN